MAIVATGSKTIVDLSDGKSLSVYLGANQPRTQIKNTDNGTFTPDWTTDEGRLVITPYVYVNQTMIPLSSDLVDVTWVRRDGSGGESALTASEVPANKTLVVTANNLSRSSAGLLTYVAKVEYGDNESGTIISAEAEVSFALVTTGASSKSVWISGEQVFKCNAEGTSVSPDFIILTANAQNTSITKWQYKNAAGSWIDYPIDTDNTRIDTSTLKVSPDQAVIWNGDMTAIRVTTTAGVSDYTSIYKVFDGANGSNGDNGEAARTVFLSNENITFAGNASGQIAAVTKTCHVVAYVGATKTAPTGVTVTGNPEGMAVRVGTANADREVPIMITIDANATLGGAGERQGELIVSIGSPVNTDLKIQWSKVNTGATGENAIVMTLYAPDGTVFTNHGGEKTVAVAAYDGTTVITDTTADATFEWFVFEGLTWKTLTDETNDRIVVAGTDIVGLGTYCCKMTYKGKSYTDVITLTDKTDNYQAVIESSGGEIFKNTQGNSTLKCILFQNGNEVDQEGNAFNYLWYRFDKDGNALDTTKEFMSGKSIDVDGSHVGGKTTFICRVFIKE